MIKKLKQARMQFVEHFDYTIDKYGTVVPEEVPRPTVIYD